MQVRKVNMCKITVAARFSNVKLLD
uniref:Uncharacterized protein n=1 Tax=Anguilla anguilla TaxID=7936 RepID=A0A0E9VMX7_ANGAN